MKNSKLITIFAFTTFFTWAQPSLAGEGSGTVTLEFVGNTSSPTSANQTDVFFYTTTHTNKPECNTHRSRWIYSGPAAGAEIIIEAARTGREIRVIGSNACATIYSGKDKFASEIASLVGYPVDYSLHP